ncbi:type II toxin-antitoxin system RelE/ParE family toxin [Mesorhizobium sp.]|uniref:type II toxin-antitoxin system RelE/ParE family toxin n=1 Tax=Mesorhizobium sp. TaxID=1871066 RepID=UPI0025D7C566|nr:type II toxin-antitoxin system RelE/ParE family toxin [Mesorhizobium sp.]
MIRSFKNKTSEAVSTGKALKGFPADLVRVAQRKLFMLDNAAELVDLRVPPGNRLEALKGDRAGQYSIRINDQFRICFRWTDGGAEDVEITDYH